MSLSSACLGATCMARPDRRFRAVNISIFRQSPATGFASVSALLTPSPKCAREGLGFSHREKSALFLMIIETVATYSWMEYRANRDIVFSCKYHLLFCRKHRRQVLVIGVDRRPKQIIAEVAEETGSILLEAAVMPDHVHYLIEVDPQFGIHRAVKAIEGRSSRLLRNAFR